MQPFKIRTIVLSVGIVLLIGVCGWLVSKETRSVVSAEGPDCTVERRESTVHAQINPKLPLFYIRVLSSTCLEPGRIEIKSDNSSWSQAAQVIELASWLESDSAPRFFHLQDINFDGFLDICIFGPGGAKFGTLHCWVFDRDSGMFIETPYSKEFGTITAHDMRLYPEQKKIVTNHFRGTNVCCKSIYKVVGEHVLLAEEYDQEVLYDENSHPLDRCRITHTIYKGNKPIVTSKVVPNFCAGYYKAL